MPDAYIVAGPNGAGKTTLALKIADELGIPYVGADAIAERIDPARPIRARVQASREFFAEVHRLASEGRSFVCESTLAGRGFGHHLSALRDAGYTVSIQYVFVSSVEVCLARIAERVRRGGHDVPIEDVIRRFVRSKHNFWSVYRHQVDDWQLLYNGSDGFRPVQAGGRGWRIQYDTPLLKLFRTDVPTSDGKRPL